MMVDCRLSGLRPPLRGPVHGRSPLRGRRPTVPSTTVVLRAPPRPPNQNRYPVRGCRPLRARSRPSPTVPSPPPSVCSHRPMVPSVSTVPRAVSSVYPETRTRAWSPSPPALVPLGSLHPRPPFTVWCPLISKTTPPSPFPRSATETFVCPRPKAIENGPRAPK